MPLPRRGPAHAGPHTLVEQARRWMVNGNYHRASVAFEKLGREAEKLAPARSPLMYYQAGRCRIFMGDLDAGLGLVYQALSTMAVQDRRPELLRSGQMIISELQDRGAATQAEAMQIWLDQKLITPPMQRTDDHAHSDNSQILQSCPFCGVPLSSESNKGMDSDAITCDNCGGLVRAQ